MMRGMLPLALSFILTACAQVSIDSPGKSDAAILADMKSCGAGSLHDRSVINCLNSHGDTITYADGSIPPYTTGNPYDVPMTAAEVQRRTAAATAVLERWKAAARNSDQNPGATAVVPMPVATTPSNTISGTGETTFIDDAMRADLKEVLSRNGTQTYPRGVLTGVPGDDEQRAIVYEAEPVGNYFFYRNGTVLPAPQGGIDWSTDKDLQDFVKARRWYQLALITNPVRHSTFESDIKNCDFNLSDANGSARSEIAAGKNQDRIASEERQKKLAARKKVGDCVVMSGGTGFLGLGPTTATVTGVSGDTVSWVAHLHRNGHWAPAIMGGSYYVAPQDFDREGSSKYDEVSLCN